MAFVKEKERSVPVIHKSDICVIGGSCTGVFAAVRAARMGASVSIIENNGYFGGAATAGLVNIWHSLFDSTGKEQIIGGLTDEVIQRLQKRNAVSQEENEFNGNYFLNSSELIIALDWLVSEQPGIKVFLHTRFVDAVSDGKKITHVIIEDKSGRRAIKADYFIDASGDGDLAARAGFQFTKSKKPEAPASCAVIYGMERLRKLNPGFNLSSVLSNPKYPEFLRESFFCDSPVPGIPGARMISGTCAHESDCTDAEQLSFAEMESRRQVEMICRILKDNFQGGENISLARLPASISIRESRHISCLHHISGYEISQGVHYPDAIACGSHFSSSPHYSPQDIQGDKKLPPFYQIPYRSLVPQGAFNLLVCGRLIDAGGEAYNSVCVMVNCNQTGEAAGTASVLALDRGMDISIIDTNMLRSTMKKDASIII